MFNIKMMHVISVAALQTVPVAAFAQNIPRIDEILDVTHQSTVANYGFFGSTAGVEFGDGTRWFSATGVTGPNGASQGGRDLIVADRFHIGSQTKTYTGTVVLKLIDQGVIGMSDTLQDWYQHQPYAMQALSVMGQDLREIVTVHDLLSMRTGIPEPLAGADPYTPDKTILDVWNAKTGKYDLTVQQMLVASLGLGSTMTPGDENTFEYSNMNFMLLGLIAEAASCQLGDCKTIRELITHHVIEAEGLTNTIYPLGTEWGTDQHTNGTWDNYGAISDFTETTPAVPNAAGAMISDIDDQLTWLVEVTTNRRGTISDDLFAQRLENTHKMNSKVGHERAGYGLALYGQHSLDTGAFMLGHGGEISGYQTLMFRYPGDASTDMDDLFVVANVNTFLNVQNSRIFGASDVHSMYYDLQRSATMYTLFEAAPDGCRSNSTGIFCSGTTLADTTLPVFKTNLIIQPSGDRWVAPQVDFDEPVPTWVFYHHNATGIAAVDATISIEAQGRLEGYGNDMTLVDLSGAANHIGVQGDIRATGKSAIAIDAGSPSNDVVIIDTSGTVTGDIVATGGTDQIIVAGTVNGDVTLGPDATLVGAGVIEGMVSGAGTLTPGTPDATSPDTLTITRYEADGGTLNIAIYGPEGSAASLLVDLQLSEGFSVPQTGRAVLNGGTLRLSGTAPTDDQMILLVHSDQGITGKFSTIEDPNNMLGSTGNGITSQVVYTDKSVFLRSRRH